MPSLHKPLLACRIFRQSLGPIAEMMAIRHLLWDEETSDEKFSIRAVELEVASPSIINVLEKTSERKNQERYASLLRTAFLGVDIWAREEPVSSIIPTLGPVDVSHW